MANNPVERNFVTRFILGLAVVAGMMIGGMAVGMAFESLNLPAGDWVGVGVGAVIVFVAFAAWYVRYDASFDTS